MNQKKIPLFPKKWGSVDPEMYKRDRECLVHPFTHERGSLLAHIFGELKFL